MPPERLSAGRRAELMALARFCVVGAISTLVYVGTSFALLWLALAPPAAVNLVALAAGIAASYFGHHGFTYRRAGHHAFFGTRFLVVTAILAGGSVLFTHVAVDVFRVSAYRGALAVSVLYPVASLLLHHFWTFARGR